MLQTCVFKSPTAKFGTIRDSTSKAEKEDYDQQLWQQIQVLKIPKSPNNLTAAESMLKQRSAGFCTMKKEI